MTAGTSTAIELGAALFGVIGTMLLAINGQPVKGVEQVREVLAKHPKHVALLVSRDGQQIFVPVDIG